MLKTRSVITRPPSLRLKVGNWLEAQASGWAVVLVPVVLALLLAAAWVR